jgi:thymidylate synthase
MKSYLDIVDKVLSEGRKKPNRTAIDSIAYPFITFDHDMSEGFPLLTTKKMPIYTIAAELEGFIKGVINKEWFQNRGCNIWNEWCNPERVPSNLPEQDRLEFQKNENELGPIYGYQWRRFNYIHPSKEGHKGCMTRHDQFSDIVNQLHADPNSRRMVCSAWNPCQAHLQALPPCHVMWNVVVIDGKLNLGWHQRSADLMLGVPFNIASYAMLLKLLAKEAGLEEGRLFGTFADCHIYENHIKEAKNQLKREPFALPKLDVVVDTSIYNWFYEHFILRDYVSHPKINFGGVAV